MRKVNLDVLGIGNAVVDIIVRTDDAKLRELSLEKGSMHLSEAPFTNALYRALKPEMEVAGGSAANTMVAVASLGGKTAFIGAVGKDEYGKKFVSSLKEHGVFTVCTVHEGSLPTAHSYILVTPDSIRTMKTYLGVAKDFNEHDVDETLVAGAKITFIEGYLLDCKGGEAAIRKAVELAQWYGHKVALALSDPHCVKRHRSTFHELIDNKVDIVIANTKEINALFDTNDHNVSIQHMQEKCKHDDVVAALTRSEKGVVILEGEKRYDVKGLVVPNIVDTTGVGALFSGGFLYSLTQDYGLPAAGELGNLCAAQGLVNLGARVDFSLASLLKKQAEGM